MTELEKYVLIFFVYSFGGWIMESTRGWIKTKKFVNRGYLIGPCLPVYGFGLVLLTLCLNSYTNDIIVLFGMSIILCGCLEYFTSWIMEKLFKARWWDYHNRKFNINGRVCLETLLPFGIAGTILLKWANPFILDKLSLIPSKTLKIIILIIIAIFSIDFIISTLVISNLRKTATNLEKEEIAKDSTEEISEKVKEIAIEKVIEIKDDAAEKVQTIKDQASIRVKELKTNAKELSDGALKTINDSRKILKEQLLNRITTTNEFTEAVKEKFSKTWLNRRFLKAFPNLEIKSKLLKLKEDRFNK